MRFSIPLIGLMSLSAGGAHEAPRAERANAGAVQRFTGDPYDVTDDAGHVGGLVCGRGVGGTTRVEGDHVLIDSPLFLEVKPDSDGRRITGTFGSRPGTGEIDLVISDGKLTGRAGIRAFELHAEGDAFVGTMSASNTPGAVSATLQGRRSLLRMPPEVLATVLPVLLNCHKPFSEVVAANRPPLKVRVGGPAVAQAVDDTEIR